MQNEKLKAGFTLIELLVVIAVISLLASIVLASLSQAKAKARVARTAAELRQMVTAVYRYYDDTGTTPPRDLPGGSDDDCEIAMFVTGKFKIDPDGNGAQGATDPKPASWSGPYMSQWPKNQWGGNYMWEFFGCNGYQPCIDAGGSDTYIVGLIRVPISNQSELIALGKILDPNGDPDIAWIDDAADGSKTFRYAPFRGLFHKTLIDGSYPRAGNCGV